MPSMSGTLGPVMSASRRPTVAPARASATARFTAIVLLPTPPLPDATAMTFLTPGTSCSGRAGAERRTIDDQVMSTESAPIERTADWAFASISSLRGQAGVVSWMVKATLLPSMTTSLTMSRVMMSRPSSGSWTVRSTSRMAPSVSSIIGRGPRLGWFFVGWALVIVPPPPEDRGRRSPAEGTVRPRAARRSRPPRTHRRGPLHRTTRFARNGPFRREARTESGALTSDSARSYPPATCDRRPAAGW